ncbi:hypothetical protein JXL21_09775 [Candidatus Bathyarchaeota archaeon]|nr:hypothetical protein [Candidatus Bathyarchaeota archaeon]
MSEDKLAELLENGKDWAKVKTTVPGVFVMKMPGSKYREPSLSVEINPVDASGSPTKRRGLIIRSVEEYMEFKDILSNEKLESLLEMLEDVNPESMKPGKTSKDVIEI